MEGANYSGRAGTPPETRRRQVNCGDGFPNCVSHMVGPESKANSTLKRLSMQEMCGIKIQPNISFSPLLRDLKGGKANSKFLGQIPQQRRVWWSYLHKHTPQINLCLFERLKSGGFICTICCHSHGSKLFKPFPAFSLKVLHRGCSLKGLLSAQALFDRCTRIVIHTDCNLFSALLRDPTRANVQI